MKTKVRWIEGMRFIGETDSGHLVVMDAPKESGGENLAPSPMTILLTTLGGCTGMDVVSILKKMKEKVANFSIEIGAQRREEHPRIFSEIEMVYKFQGEDLNRENIEKAVKLSFEKYCSVGAILKFSCPVKYRIEII